MRRALELALRGAGRTNPNPLVGAVLVRDGRVIGEGWHRRYGDLHAEREALRDCRARGEDPRGATMYVTLEPCSHHGHQPPCADALADAGIARAVVGSRDPNPLVAGRGAERLRTAGVEVAEDVLRSECDAINQVFFHYITTKTPYVLAKWAMTADGRIACASGDSRWVSGEAARRHGHLLRNRLAAIMVGVGTVAADDPLLTCRVAGGRNPVRVVCDTHLSIPLDSRLVESAGEVPLLVACASGGIGPDGRLNARGGADDACACGGADEDAFRAKADALRARGVEVVDVPPDASGRVDLCALMRELAVREIDSVLLEGGARLHAAAFAAGVVDEVVAYVAPKVVGGAGALGPVGGEGAVRMADALALGAPRVGFLGDDVCVAWRAGEGARDPAAACVATGPLGLDDALAPDDSATRDFGSAAPGEAAAPVRGSAGRC